MKNKKKTFDLVLLAKIFLLFYNLSGQKNRLINQDLVLVFFLEFGSDILMMIMQVQGNGILSFLYEV